MEGLLSASVKCDSAEQVSWRVDGGRQSTTICTGVCCDLFFAGGDEGLGGGVGG